ncbi:MAG: glycerophosphodiester phosphodiesterase [Spirochaetota bacterium]
MGLHFFHPMPVVLAHRGDSISFPENTLEAFFSAQTIPVDVIETDVHITADGEVVIWHDDYLDRMTDGSGKVEACTLAELLKFDAGFNFTPDNGQTYPFRGQGIRLLTLKDALHKLPEMKFNVDLKTPSPELAEAFARLVKAHRAENRILCASFHSENVRYMRINHPEITTSMAYGEVAHVLPLQKLRLPIPRRMLPGAAFQVPIRHGSIRVVTPNFIKRFHKLGKYVQVWTVNDKLEMKRLLQMGVDGIFTDNPRLLRSVVADLQAEGILPVEK